MPLFDFLKGAKGVGRRFLDAALLRVRKEDVPSPIAGRLAPYAKGASLLEKEFLKHQKSLREHRGRLRAPKPFQDRPSFGDQVELYDAFLRQGEWLPLTSSWISAARYDAERMELSLRFDDGGGVVVEEISGDMAGDFISTHSHGIWIWDHVLVRGEGNKGKVQRPVRPL